ncbi:MAG: OmpA family protein [Myxococcota bacterium]
MDIKPAHTIIVMLAGLAVSPLAFAQDEGAYSTDIELLNPSFSRDAVPGVDSPTLFEAGTWRTGLLTQFQQDPLVLYDSGNEIGAIVEQRWAVHAAGMYTFARNAAVRIVLPTYTNVGTETPNFAAEGFGLGDIQLGLRFRALEAGPLTVGVRGDLMAPTGRKLAYMGESGLRVGGALLAQLDIGPVDVMVDAGAIARSAIETEEDLTLGSELRLNGALRGEILRERLWLFAGALNRGGFANLYTPESAENPLEAIGGLQFKPLDQLQIDVGGGRGITDGYGTTQQRFFVGATWRFVEREEDIVIEEPIVEDVYVPVLDIEEIVQEETWAENELARVVNEQIVIKDPIQFEFNTNRVLPESVPTLRYVARLLNGNDRIGHVVIEGHASEEGSFEYNYKLSMDRALAVWEQLILAKVHPDRISVRAYGEVKPRNLDEETAALLTEAELAENRRVEFKIVRQYGPLDIVPEYKTDIQVPWNGSDYTAAQPPPNQTVNAGLPTEEELQQAQVPEEENLDQDLFLDEEDDVFDEDVSFDDVTGDGEKKGEEEETPETPDDTENEDDGGGSPGEDGNDSNDSGTENEGEPSP